MEILKTNKNDYYFLIDGSIFRCDRRVLEESATEEYYRCDIRSDRCPARAIEVLYMVAQKDILNLSFRPCYVS